MGKSTEFMIPFKGLGIGMHEFTYNISEAFFGKIEYSEIKKGSVKVDLFLEKQENMLVLNFKITGKVEVNCDRCLEAFDYPVAGNQQLIVKFGEKREEEGDEILIIPESDHQIDIAPYIYEYIYLLLPLQRIHPDDDEGNITCNNEVIKKLNELKKQNTIDPRWEALKKLKNND